MQQLLISHASMWNYLRHYSKRCFLCFHHSSFSATVRTDFNTTARFSTSPATTITCIERRYFDVSLPSKYRLFKAQIKVITGKQEINSLPDIQLMKKTDYEGRTNQSFLSSSITSNIISKQSWWRSYSVFFSSIFLLLFHWCR